MAAGVKKRVSEATTRDLLTGWGGGGGRESGRGTAAEGGIQGPSLELSLRGPAAEHQTVCTLETVRAALERAAAEQRRRRIWSPPVRSSASSTTTASFSPPGKRRRESTRSADPDPDSISSSASSVTLGDESTMFAAACPSCLSYVLTQRGNPACPRCHVAVPPPPAQLAAPPSSPPLRTLMFF